MSHVLPLDPLTLSPFSFSDFRSRTLGGYIHIDRNVGGDCDNNSLPGVEDDTDIRGHDVLFVLCVPCTGHCTSIFERPLFWIAGTKGLGHCQSNFSK
jgi:hypothetical protein